MLFLVSTKEKNQKARRYCPGGFFEISAINNIVFGMFTVLQYNES